MSDETTTIDGIAHERLTERRTTSGSDDVAERQICSVCCRQQPDAYGYDEYRSEDWPCPAVQKARFRDCYGVAVAELSEARQENARLRERVAALEAACYEEVPEGGPFTFSGFTCFLCGWDCSPEFKAEHEPSCVLYEADERQGGER